MYKYSVKKIIIYITTRTLYPSRTCSSSVGKDLIGFVKKRFMASTIIIARTTIESREMFVEVMLRGRDSSRRITAQTSWVQSTAYKSKEQTERT